MGGAVKIAVLGLLLASSALFEPIREGSFRVGKENRDAPADAKSETREDSFNLGKDKHEAEVDAKSETREDSLNVGKGKHGAELDAKSETQEDSLNVGKHEHEVEADAKPKTQRECLQPLGPYNNEYCLQFKERWVKKDEGQPEKLRSELQSSENADGKLPENAKGKLPEHAQEKLKKLHSEFQSSEALQNMSNKDVVVTIGCYAVYTFSQAMLESCVDAKLLLDLLLCQYDYLEDKDTLLSQFHNVKTREDLVNFIGDIKKCLGTSPEPLPFNETGMEAMGIVGIFVKPVKKLRSFIESNI